MRILKLETLISGNPLAPFPGDGKLGIFCCPGVYPPHISTCIKPLPSSFYLGVEHRFNFLYCFNMDATSDMEKTRLSDEKRPSQVLPGDVVDMQGSYTPEEEKALVRKIDKVILPFVSTYALFQRTEYLMD
jgi:hypothetical protein